MEKIKLEYKPFSFLKYTRTIKGQFPTTFDELKPAQLIAIAGLINQTISETDFLKIMTGIKKFRINKLDEYYRYQIMILFEPFTEIKPYHAFIIPEIKTPETILHSPRPKLSGVTFGQFIFIESYFTSYQTNKLTLDLYKFVASLYLPEGHSFDENAICHWELDHPKVKTEILDAIVINYVLIKEWLALAYPLVFQGEEENEEVSKPKKHNQSSNNSGWLKIYDNVVGDDLINQDKYAQLPLHSVLRWMTGKIKESMKRK